MPLTLGPDRFRACAHASIVALLAAAPAWPNQSAPATEVLEVAPAQPCVRCDVVFSPVITLGKDGNGPARILYGVWAVDLRHNYYVGGSTLAEVSRFDSAGRLLERF